ncbi:MAG: phage tail length tape measure family protein, partial [Anaerolineae bacterium]|nr:phage tail length tape measure family protein [Anaerolineae bacterium]
MNGTQVASLFAVLDLKDNMSAGLDEAKTKIGGFGGTASTVLKGAGMAGLAGGAAIAAGLGYAVKEAMDAEATLAKVDAVIKATGGAAGLTTQQVADMATGLSQVTRFSDDTILEGQAMLLTFKEIGGDIFPETTSTMLDMAEMFGSVDQAAVMLGKALNDPVSGITALQRVGVQFTESQREAINELVEMGDVAGAQRIILDELDSQMGGVAEAAGDTLTGKIDILKNSFSDMAEGLGTELIPLITDFIDVLTADVLPAVQDVATAVGDFLGGITTAFDEGGFEAVGQYLLDSFSEGLGDVSVWAQENLITPLTDYLGTLTWDDVSNRLRGLLTKLLGIMASGIGSIAEWVGNKVIDPIIAYLGEVNWADVGNKLLDLLGQLLGFAGAGLVSVGEWAYANIITPIIDKLTAQETWTAVWDAAKQVGQKIFEGLLDALSGLAAALVKIIDDAIPNQVSFGTVHVPDLGPFGGGYDVS